MSQLLDFPKSLWQGVFVESLLEIHIYTILQMMLTQSKDIYPRTWIFKFTFNNNNNKKIDLSSKKGCSLIKLSGFVGMIHKISVLILQASYIKKKVFGCTISSNRGVNLKILHESLSRSGYK